MFIVSVIIARTLGTEYKGLYDYITLVFLLIANHAHFGLNDATIHFFRDPTIENQDLVNTNFTILSIIAALLSIVVIFLRSQGLFLAEYKFNLIIIGLVYVYSVFLFGLFRHYYIRYEQIKFVNRTVLFSLFVSTICVILARIFGLLSIGTAYFCVSLQMIINAAILFCRSHFKLKFHFNLKLLKIQYEYCIFAYLAVLFVVLNYKADQVMIKFLLGNSKLGIYSVGVVLADLLFLIPSSVGVALLGKLYNSDLSKEESLDIITKTIKYTFYLSVVVAFIGMLMTPIIGVVYGSDYIAAQQVTCILLVGVAMASIGKSSNAYFYREGKIKTYMFLTFVTFFINMVMNYFLIPRFGINGAAIASTISYSLYGFLHLFYFIVVEGVKIDELLFLKKQDLSSIYRAIISVQKKMKVRI
jgi:O-antigen/teichoic acid export membrane protein